MGRSGSLAFMRRMGFIGRIGLMGIIGLIIAEAVLAGAAGSAQAGEPAAAVRKRSTPQRIIGGTVAAATRWPWQVALLRAATRNALEAQYCGGTLIASRWVLTAAHCLVDEQGAAADAETVNVLVGTSDLLRGGQRLAVQRVVVHPGYDDRTDANDIALLELRTAASQTPVTRVTPETAARYARSGTRSTLLGWGDTDADPTATRFPRQLMQVEFPIVNDALCQAIYPEYSRTMLCAGARRGGKDTCQGDSGGPLLVQGAGGAWLQAGIVSFGNGCADAGVYGVYTRLSRYGDWIEAYLNPGSLHLLTVRRRGNGEGVVISMPAGLDCGDICTAAFLPGRTVSLTAQPARGSAFGGWSDDCAGATATTTLTLSADHACTARFVALGVTPANDDFANARVLSGSSGRIAGNSTLASDQDGEPRHNGVGGGRSLWYRWTAPASGTLTLNTRGSGFDTVLAVYTGTAVNLLRESASNDDAPDAAANAVHSSLSTPVASGQVYRIAVDGWRGESGRVVLAWSFSRR